jgi:hypothetical protein
MRTDEEPVDFFYQLDDPAFLVERARLRSRLEHVPENALGRPGLERPYDAMTDEFCRRARIAWAHGRLPGARRCRPRPAAQYGTCRLRDPPRSNLVDCAIDMLR